MFAPMLAAVGALAALLTDCSIAVEREQSSQSSTEASETATPADSAEAEPGSVTSE